MYYFKHIYSFIHVLPLILPLIISIAGTVAIILLIFGAFKTWLFLLICIPLSVLTAYFVSSKYLSIYRPQVKKTLLYDVILLVGLVFWIGFNGLYTSQHIYTDRDPAVYANTAYWLIEHEEAEINTINIFNGIEDLDINSGGILKVFDNENSLQFQGSHMLPALLALGGRAVGEDILLRLNVIIGGLALLSFYGYSRFFLNSKWALLATFLLSVTLPFIYFSRNLYTEPLVVLILFGTLSMVHLSMKTKNKVLWGLSGAYLGSLAIVRIDSYLLLLAMALFIILMLAVVNKKDRLDALKNAMFFILTAFSVSIIGYFDVTNLSEVYYDGHRKEIILQILAILGVVLVLMPLSLLVAWKTRILKKISNIAISKRAFIVALGIVVLGILSYVQKFFRVGYDNEVFEIVKALQADIDLYPLTSFINGQEVTRNFAELTVSWVIWYLGPIVVVLGFAGLVLAVYRSVKYADYYILPLIFMIIITATLYFIDPHITPDHIWAVRRFLPVVIPGIIFFIFYFMKELWELDIIKGNIVLRSALIVLIVIAIYYPMKITYPFVQTREYVPHVQSIRDLCNSVDKDNALFVWIGGGRTNAMMPTMNYCQAPVYGYGELYGDKPTLEVDTARQISSQAYANGFTPYIVAYGLDLQLLKTGDSNNMRLVHESSSEILERELLEPPKETVDISKEIYVGVLDQTGSISILP